ncbi:MAG: adenylyltransferase/cytidyltransferase family protein [Candidatus Omnitrophica bacterium]|nr:adenylyltransferase/cytidyltransferase family protein [Candidatus Omnitrophota bacterium]
MNLPNEAATPRKVDHFSEKIKTLDDLAEIIKGLKASGQKVVMCHGVFDLLHPGHIHHFYAARKNGDRLIVTITRDEHVGKGPGRPVFNQRLRAESVAAIECVDYIAVNEWPTAIETIRKLKPDFYAKGSDYANSNDDVTGNIHLEKAAIQEVGGKLVFTDEVSFSSSHILNTHFDVYSDEARNFLKSFREKYTADDIVDRLKNLSKLKILLIGDTIIDEYHYCQAMGKSPKETFVTTRFVSEESFAGGVLACANHAAGFCEQVDLITCLGSKDPREDFIRKHLKPNVRPTFLYRDDAPTIVKRRFVDPVFLSKMFQVSFLKDSRLPSAVDKSLRDQLEKILPNYDAVLVADYGHGLLSPETINLLAEKAPFLAANTQTNSANLGYNLITKYPRVDYICIDEPEIRLAMHDRGTRLEDLIMRVHRQIKNQRVMITRGHLGAIAYSENDGFFETPIFSNEIVDRVGAGDAFFAVTAPCAAQNFPTDLLGFVGNLVGALAVRIVCNRSFIEPIPLYRFIQTVLK